MNNNMGKYGFIVSIIGIVVAILTWLFPIGNPSNSVVVIGSNMPHIVTDINKPILSKTIANNRTPKTKFTNQHHNEENETSTKVQNTLNYKKATLSISGTGALVKIKKSKSGVIYEGGSISGTGSDSIIYLPKGQYLSINVTGTGVDIEVESEILEFISVSDFGTGTDLSEI